MVEIEVVEAKLAAAHAEVRKLAEEKAALHAALSKVVAAKSSEYRWLMHAVYEAEKAL